MHEIHWCYLGMKSKYWKLKCWIKWFGQTQNLKTEVLLEKQHVSNLTVQWNEKIYILLFYAKWTGIIQYFALCKYVKQVALGESSEVFRTCALCRGSACCNLPSCWWSGEVEGSQSNMDFPHQQSRKAHGRFAHLTSTANKNNYQNNQHTSHSKLVKLSSSEWTPLKFQTHQ